MKSFQVLYLKSTSIFYQIFSIYYTLHVNFVADQPSSDSDYEKEIIEYHFNCSYTYEVIIYFLENHHGVIMNICTLKRRLKKYGLKQKRVPVDEETVRSLVRVEWQIPGSSQDTEAFGIHSDWFIKSIHLEKWWLRFYMS